MTDDRLIQLIEERPPDELGGDVLAEIHSRLASSPALREALLMHLQVDQALHQTVAQYRLPVELLLAKVAAVQATSTVARLFGWGSVTALVIGMVSVGTIVALREQGPLDVARPQAVEILAIDEPESPSDIAPGDRGDTALSSTGENGEDNREVLPPERDRAMHEQPRDIYFADAQDASVWRESLESVTGDVAQRVVGDQAELVLHGAQLLRSPWPAAGRMRLTLADHDRFKIHLSSSMGAAAPTELPARLAWPASPSSLSLEYFAAPRPMWVAWLAARRANQELPDVLALAAHDQGLSSQLTSGTIDVFYQRGEIVLTHGETELLAAPLAGPPDRIVFEGEAVVQGLTFAEGLIAAADRTALAPVVDAMAPPADRDWQCELPAGAKWSTLAEGRLELLAEDSQSDARAACSLDGLDAQEIAFQLEDPLPGTGIVLCDVRGDAGYRLGFVSGPKPNQVCFKLISQDIAVAELGEGPMPLCPARPWFRFLVGGGRVQAWFSCNGSHWSSVLSPDLAIEGRIMTAGVYCLPGPGTRSIRIAKFAALGAESPPQTAGDLLGRTFPESAVRAAPFSFYRREHRLLATAIVER
jgi:hypothetical protein